MKLPRYWFAGYYGKVWVAYYYLIDMHLWALGMSLDFRSPNIELHIGPGFFRIGKLSGGPWPDAPGWIWGPRG